MDQPVFIPELCTDAGSTTNESGTPLTVEAQPQRRVKKDKAGDELPKMDGTALSSGNSVPRMGELCKL